MTNTWYASDWDQAYRPSYAKIRRTVVRHIQEKIKTFLSERRFFVFLGKKINKLIFMKVFWGEKIKTGNLLICESNKDHVRVLQYIIEYHMYKK